MRPTTELAIRTPATIRARHGQRGPAFPSSSFHEEASPLGTRYERGERRVNGAASAARVASRGRDSDRGRRAGWTFRESPRPLQLDGLVIASLPALTLDQEVVEEKAGGAGRKLSLLAFSLVHGPAGMTPVFRSSSINTPFHSSEETDFTPRLPFPEKAN
jgi:hypothetical protein